MKKITSILLLLTLSFECFSSIYVWAGYELNKGFIAKNLCINRDDPAMHCDGKCFLKKQLKQNQQRKDKDNTTIGNKAGLLFLCSDAKILSYPDLQPLPIIFSWVNPGNYSSPFFTFFHPPKYAV